MKIISPVFALLFLQIACTDPEDAPPSSGTVEVFQSALQTILDSAQVHGTILIHPAHSDTFYSNDFQWAHKGQLPASTYKIPHSIIALETGVVEDDSTLFKWDGEDRWLDSWEQDLVFKDAFQLSCVPCYQEIARKVGLQRMRLNLDKLQYMGMVFDSSTIDRFWLGGASRITPFEQIEFLDRLYHSELAIKARSVQLLKKIMILEESSQYTLSGKTGWSIQNEINNGWFVGFLEKGDVTIFFATNISPKKTFDMDFFGEIRKTVTMEALRAMNFI